MLRCHIGLLVRSSEHRKIRSNKCNEMHRSTTWMLAAAMAVLAQSAAAQDAGPATGPPRIVSGLLLTPNVDVRRAPAAPAIKFRYAAPAALASIGTLFESPFGQTYIETFNDTAPIDKFGSIVVRASSTPMSLYARPGVWLINQVTITDFAGKHTTYSGSQLATIFSTGQININVINNGTPDTKLPIISAGKLLTPKVSLGSAVPYFLAQLTVADDLSGVGSAFVFLSGPNAGPSVTARVFPSAPITASGTIVAGADMSGLGADVGTWTIVAYEVCDVATNCLFDSTPAHIGKLFGTTKFQLTK